jgi:hypothetical protein
MATQQTPVSPQQNQQYETFYLNKLESDVQKELQQIQAYVHQHSPGLKPQEIIAILNNLHAWEQYFLWYDAWAQYLSTAGLPKLSQRLAQVRNDLRGALKVYSEMYQSAVQNQADIARIQMDAQRYVTATLMDMNTRTQAVYDRCNEMRRLVNEGVPVGMAELISRLPK